jgi:phage replication O-like protein O
MASPQTANGYGRLANELAQAIYRFPFSGQELRVVLYVIRHSYGWQRKETMPTTVRLLAADVSVPAATIGWVLKGLSRRGILIREPSGALRLNKNYDEWLRRGAGTLQLTITPRSAHAAGATPEPARKLTPAWRPPTLEEVRATCAERKSVVDPERFWHHHEGVGWRKGKTPITDWIAILAFWERTDRNSGRHASGRPCPLCERPITNKNAVVCENCVKCRKCNKQTAQLKIFKRPDGTTTAWCLECAKGR